MHARRHSQAGRAAGAGRGGGPAGRAGRHSTGLRSSRYAAQSHEHSARGASQRRSLGARAALHPAGAGVLDAAGRLGAAGRCPGGTRLHRQRAAGRARHLCRRGAPARGQPGALFPGADQRPAYIWRACSAPARISERAGHGPLRASDPTTSHRARRWRDTDDPTRRPAMNPGVSQQTAAAQVMRESWLAHTGRLTLWNLRLARRRLMSKILAAILLLLFLVEIFFLVIVLVSERATTQSYTACPPTPASTAVTTEPGPPSSQPCVPATTGQDQQTQAIDQELAQTLTFPGI